MADIQAAKAELLELSYGEKPSQDEVNAQDHMSRELAKYFNPPAQMEGSKPPKEASLIRLSIFTLGDSDAVSVGQVKAILQKYDTPKAP